MAILFTLIVFARNLQRGIPGRNTFCILFWCLAWNTNPGFTSNKPPHCLLDYDDLNKQSALKSAIIAHTTSSHSLLLYSQRFHFITKRSLLFAVGFDVSALISFHLGFLCGNFLYKSAFKKCNPLKNA